MPLVEIKRSRLTKFQKEQLTEYLQGKIGILTVSDAFPGTHQVIRSLSTRILRKAVQDGDIDIEAVLKKF